MNWNVKVGRCQHICLVLNQPLVYRNHVKLAESMILFGQWAECDNTLIGKRSGITHGGRSFIRFLQCC
jgi:hypothetical protein